MSSKLYFAYGSNLNAADWSNWCLKRGFHEPNSLLRFHSIGYLPDYDICFSYQSKSRDGGVLDIKPRPGQAVPGVIFEVSAEGWAALDKKEGAPQCYERVEQFAIDDQGREFAVVTYQVPACRRVPFVQPQDDYVRIVREGLKKYDLPTSHLDAASVNKKTPWLVDGFFVYGTLMRGENRFHTLKSCGLKCTLLAENWGRLVDLGSFPGYIDTGSEGRMVQGDFVRVRDVSGAIEKLDRIEGFEGFGNDASLFRRTLLGVGVGDGRVRLAWVYCLVANADEAAEILSGDWREHRGVRGSFIEKIVAGHTGGDEVRIANEIATKLPFSFNPNNNLVAQSLVPLATAVNSGTISERQLAQISGRWVVVP